MFNFTEGALLLGHQTLLMFPKHCILAQSLWKEPVVDKWWEEEVPAGLRWAKAILKVLVPPRRHLRS